MGETYNLCPSHYKIYVQFVEIRVKKIIAESYMITWWLANGLAIVIRVVENSVLQNDIAANWWRRQPRRQWRISRRWWWCSQTTCFLIWLSALLHIDCKPLPELDECNATKLRWSWTDSAQTILRREKEAGNCVDALFSTNEHWPQERARRKR